MQNLLNQIAEVILPTPGWCTPEKAADLAQLIINRRPRFAVESGVYGGRSLFAMAMAFRFLGSGYAVGVDPWSIEAAIEGESKANADWWAHNADLKKVYAGFVRNVSDHQLTEECRWIRAKGEQACRVFEDGSIDFFHLDSNHSEIVSCAEVTAWAPKMAPNSIWIMDDADWATQAKAIAMIKAQGFTVLSDQKTYIVFSRIQHHYLTEL